MGLADLNKYKSAYASGLQQAPDNPTLNSALGMCFLKLGSYGEASTHFAKAMVDDCGNSETYFYAAVALLGGKKAFLATRDTVQKCEGYLNSAVLLEPRGVYYLMLAYLAHDYYERKFLKPRTSSSQFMRLAASNHLTAGDRARLKEVLRQEALGL